MADLRFLNKFPYTDFHELNTDWILEQVQSLLERVTALESELSTIDTRQENLDTRLAAINAEITNIKNRLTTLETALTIAENKATALENDAADRVQSVTYDNELDTTSEQVKQIGNIHVVKPNSGETITPVYGYIGGGVLGNCVVWSRTPFTGTGTQQDITITPATVQTLVEYKTAGSILIVYRTSFIVSSGGITLQRVGNNVQIMSGEHWLATTESFVGCWTQTSQDYTARILIPKTASGETFESNRKTNTAAFSDSYTIDPTHLYEITLLYNDNYYAGWYITGGALTQIYKDGFEDFTVTLDGTTVTVAYTSDAKTVTEFLDLGAME